MSRALLVDTQALLAIRSGDAAVGSKARREFANPGNALFLSVVSVWEMAIKTSLGKLELVGTLEELVDSALGDLGLTLLPLRVEHALRVQRLPFHHRDPFDRLLAAQALVEGLAILGGDRVFEAYGVRSVW